VRAWRHAHEGNGMKAATQRNSGRPLWRSIWRFTALFALCLAGLQITFALRVAAMALIDPGSTTFERSEAWRLLTKTGQLPWRQETVDYARISEHLKRAVIASEDAAFTDHAGIDWDSIERAWERNQQAEARAERVNASPAKARRSEPRLVGGSTISQQLAKNLFLSGERTAVRKAQEFILTMMLEALLSKQRILDIYLNHVEWGEGVFGAQAAARHYWRTDAAKLAPMQSARLAVMLPAPKRFEKRLHSAYVVNRAATIQARMAAVELP
jgi:monofunctional biosynthetic peptidoglycan transglycosylase